MKESCPSCDSTEGIREILYGLPEYPVDESKYYPGYSCDAPVASTIPLDLICVQNLKIGKKARVAAGKRKFIEISMNCRNN